MNQPVSFKKGDNIITTYMHYLQTSESVIPNKLHFRNNVNISMKLSMQN